jgi:recombination protein RecT
MSTEIAKQKTSLTIRDHLQSDALKQQLADALPKHLTADRMARVALTALTKTPKLAQCDQASFFQALLSCSAIGLEPDGRLAHLIPFQNNKTGKVDCQLIIDYKGLVELAYRSGVVKSIHADVIREGDIFEFNLGSVNRHVPWAWRPDRAAYKQGEIIGAYCVITMASACKHEVMTRDEIESIRKRSKSGSSGPWVTDFAEMAKKTVFRRASKWIPLSSEIRDAYERDDDSLVEATPTRISVTELRNVFDATDSAEVAEPATDGVVGGNL